MHRVAALVLVAVMVALGACTGETSGNTSTGTETRAGGGTDEDTAREAPDFSFETFKGDTFSLAEQRGTPVVLNFWESW
jgi:cytochrome oxidase Cu insertion factor (SCO1/SenC/PrrC family)